MQYSRRDFLRGVAVTLAGSALPRVATAATLLRFPYVQNVRRTRATVRWVTRDAGAATLDFVGDDDQSGRINAQTKEFLPAETRGTAPYYRHEAVLQKLTPGTTYRYRVSLNGSALVSDSLQFRTAGVSPFQFLAFGDSGTGSKEQKMISQLLLQHSPDFILHTGDLVYPTGTYERYETLYFEYYKDLMKHVPFFPCPGNHDYYEMKCIPYQAMNSVPEESVPASDVGRYYSFDWGNAHFVSLDTNDCLADVESGTGAMLEWLDRDLSETNKFWRIVLMHHPAYSAGNHADTWECQMVRKWIAPVLDKHHIPLVLNGHEHSYQRSYPMRDGKVASDNSGTVYVTTGGGGADLHPVRNADFLKVGVSCFNYVSCDVNNAKLRLQAFDLNGADLDSLTITPKPVLSRNSVVNAADYTNRIAAGALISIFGLQLCPEEISSQKLPLPKVLGGTSIQLNGKAIPIIMTSARQLNAQIPFDAIGACALTVQTPNGSVTVDIDVSAVAPAVFPNALFHEDGAAVSADAPARAGETLTLYATGLGKFTHEIEAGEAPDGVAVQAPVKVMVGQQAVTPTFAGSVKGLPGVCSVQFRTPMELAGQIPIQLVVGSKTSNVFVGTLVQAA